MHGHQEKRTKNRKQNGRTQINIHVNTRVNCSDDATNGGHDAKLCNVRLKAFFRLPPQPPNLSCAASSATIRSASRSPSRTHRRTYTADARTPRRYLPAVASAACTRACVCVRQDAETKIPTPFHAYTSARLEAAVERRRHLPDFRRVNVRVAVRGRFFR